jgi:cell filamentation protein, protein adenylyltransferase
MQSDKSPRPRLDPRLAQRLAEKKAQLDRRRPLTPAVVRRLQDDLRVLLTYHSNAIEGNTLTLRETQMIIEHGLTIGGHPLREYLEATNHAEAFTYLLTLADARTPISSDTILKLHHLVVQNTIDTPGQFRTIPVSIRGARLTPPPARQVEGLVAEWVAWREGAGQAYNPLLRATIAHHGFLAVHPFVDGNGRAARLLLNLMLMRAHYPPALLLRDWRIGYLAALATADTGNYNPLANLIGRAVEAGLDLYLDACAAAAEEDEQPLAELARLTGYTSAHLGWLVRQGRLAAVKRGGRWYSTLGAIERYGAEVEQGHFKSGRPRDADR